MGRNDDNGRTSGSGQHDGERTGRAGVNLNQGFSDEFVTQVITTSKTQIQVLVRRVDANSGWGQHLRLDLFIVD